MVIIADDIVFKVLLGYDTVDSRISSIGNFIFYHLYNTVNVKIVIYNHRQNVYFQR